MRSESGALLSSAEDIKKRGVEHFHELLNQPTNAVWHILRGVYIHPTLEELDAPITMAEVVTAVNNSRLRKGTGPDGILPKILAHGGSALRSFLFAIFNLLWATKELPSDWIDANVCTLFKKGDRSLCGNYRGVSLLSVVGKAFADILLQPLQYLTESFYPESLSGYRKNRGTVDGIFTLRLIMEKSREQNLHNAFIDFTKTFDSVNRELLFAILEKLGCPAKLSRVIKKLNTNVHARLIIDGELSEPIKCNSGVKQGCKLAPTLFGVYAAVLLLLAFKNICPTYSFNICFRYDGDIFDLRRLKAKTQVLTSYLRETQYADDVAIFCNDATSLQHLLSTCNGLPHKMGLRINTKKTETMSIGEYADFHVNGGKVTKVDHFKNLGSYVSNDCTYAR